MTADLLPGYPPRNLQARRGGEPEPADGPLPADRQQPRLPSLVPLIVAGLLYATTAIGNAAETAGPGESAAAGTSITSPRIPGFERFFAPAETAANGGGLLLLGELNCTSCHSGYRLGIEGADKEL